MHDHTPVLVGVGQYVARDPSDATDMLSPVDIAAEAARRALADTGAGADFREAIDVLTVIRLFEHSVRDSDLWANPFGSSTNVPGSVARRLGLSPRQSVYSAVGGQTPQRYVNRLCERIRAGEIGSALVTGAEAIATIRAATRAELELDWHEDPGGEFEDEWSEVPMATDYELRHGVAFPIHVYALFEQVRRQELGLSLPEYRRTIARLLAPFSAVSAANPYAQFPEPRDEAFIAEPSSQNYPVCEPYTKWMVAQDAVNQGAAVLLTSVARARELGIDPSRWVYLAAYADVDDVTVTRRPRLSRSWAQELAVKKALDEAGRAIGDMHHIDFYSCFPIAVSSVCEHLGMDSRDAPPLTLTGGLPYFGGPGSNYSMHAIAEVVDRIRAERDTEGIVVANGGYLSKHSVGIYCGALEGDWQPVSSADEQRRAKAQDDVTVIEDATGPGTIESYAAIYARGKPASGFIVGRHDVGDARFLARVASDDAASLGALFEEDVIGRPVDVTHTDGINTFRVAG